MNKTEFAYIDNIELEIPLNTVHEICQSGSNDEVVKNNLNEFILNQFVRYSTEEMINAVKSYGIEDVDNMTIHQIHQYILWLGAWNIYDELSEV